MKRLHILSFVSAAMLFFASCSNGGNESEPQDTRIYGEWHLVLWNAAAPSDFDVYVAFNADNTFEIYQRIEQVGYQHFSGTYLLQGNRLSGKYSDNIPWGSTYEITFGTDDKVMTMVSESSVGETSAYERSVIPQAVKENKWTVAKSYSGNTPRVL